MALLLLIRHGENNFVGKRLAGRLTGVHLNPKGRVQSEKIAAFLRQESIAAIYASPLDRTMDTAEPLARDLKLPIISQPGLLEVDFGDWQGKLISQLKKLKLWQSVQKCPSQVRFPNGESFIEAQNRVVAALEAINGAHEEKEMVACFSHCDTIRLAVAYYLNMPLDSFQRLAIDTASITLIHLGKDGATLLSSNQTAHLKP